MNRKKLTRMAGLLALPVALALLALPPGQSAKTSGETSSERSVGRSAPAHARAAEQDYFPFLQALPLLPQPAATAAAPEQADLHAGSAVNSFRTTDPTAIAELEAQLRKMRAQGATDDDVYRARAAALSPAAAAELARMEREEAIWKQRVNAYLAERDQLSRGAGSADALPRQLHELRDARFTSEEQTRLEAHEEAPGPSLMSR